MPQAHNKTVHTALDDLPYGPLDNPEAYGPVRKATAPEGVSRARLMRDIAFIAWPSFLELVLSQLTTMADQIMVGRLPGREGVQALSAVGLAGLPKFLLMTMVIAMNVGTTAIIARCRGQQNQPKANQVFRQAMVLNLMLSIGLMIVGLMAAPHLIAFMGGSGIAPDTLAQGVTYLKIQLYGFVPLCLTITVTAALRGVGDTSTPMIYNTVANGANLVLNYCLIYGKLGFPAMGVAGASLATVLGQGVAFVIAMTVAIGKKHYVSLDFKSRFRFDWDIMKNVVAIGLPSMIEQLFMRAGILIFQRAVAGLGDTMYATHQVVSNIQSMSFMVGQAFGNSTTTLMGQSLGKRRYDMAAVYMKYTRFIGLCVSLTVMLLMILFSRPLIALYNSTPEVIAVGGSILLFVAFMQPVQGDQFILSGGLRGMGDTRYSAGVVFVTTFIIRSILVVLMVNVFGWGLYGAWISLAVDQSLRTILINLRYRSGKWKVHMRKRAEAEAAKAQAS